MSQRTINIILWACLCVSMGAVIGTLGGFSDWWLWLLLPAGYWSSKLIDKILREVSQ